MPANAASERLAAERPAGTRPLQRDYPALPDAVPHARAAVARFAADAGASSDLIDDIRLAVSEALTNVVVHAYRDQGEPGRFELTAALAGDELWILISDSGCGLHARDDSPGLGLGLALMLQLSDEMDIGDRSLGGTEIRLSFPLSSEPRRRVQLRGSSDSAMAPASPRFSTTK